MNDVTPERFLGLKGMFKTAANLGIAGVMTGLAVYVVTVMLPDMQKEFQGLIREERASFREDAEKSREHGNNAVKEISEAVKELGEVITALQTKTHVNQERLIELQSKQSKVKEAK